MIHMMCTLSQGGVLDRETDTLWADSYEKLLVLIRAGVSSLENGPLKLLLQLF
jgi:hypothetical protein